jgi:hypothetical protein
LCGQVRSTNDAFSLEWDIKIVDESVELCFLANEWKPHLI